MKSLGVILALALLLATSANAAPSIASQMEAKWKEQGDLGGGEFCLSIDASDGKGKKGALCSDGNTNGNVDEGCSDEMVTGLGDVSGKDYGYVEVLNSKTNKYLCFFVEFDSGNPTGNGTIVQHSSKGECDEGMGTDTTLTVSKGKECSGAGAAILTGGLAMLVSLFAAMALSSSF